MRRMYYSRCWYVRIDEEVLSAVNVVLHLWKFKVVEHTKKWVKCKKKGS